MNVAKTKNEAQAPEQDQGAETVADETAVQPEQAPAADAPIQDPAIDAAQDPQPQERVQARVLMDIQIGERRIACDSVIEGDAAAVMQFVSAGQADTTPDAVAYALEQGAKVVSI